jgi:hypothetical protein
LDLAVKYQKSEERQVTRKQQKDGYQIVDFPLAREIVIDVMVPAERK